MSRSIKPEKPTHFDVAIVGAGPAGMAAAVLLAQKGVSVILLDEQSAAGGQIYRGLEAQSASIKTDDINDYEAGRHLLASLRAESVYCCFNASVWQIDKQDAQWHIVYSKDGSSNRVVANKLLLATGAQERPCPVPGWTLPGVMSCGGAQILLKTSAMVPKDAVLLGSGPLLYLLAIQLIENGAAPKALIETRAQGALAAALKRLPAAIKYTKPLFKGRAMLKRIKQAGVKRYTNAHSFSITQQVETPSQLVVNFSVGKGLRNQTNVAVDPASVEPVADATKTVECQSVFLHQGVIPSTHLSRSLNLAHEWHAQSHAWRPRLNRWLQGSVENVWVAGDAGGIDGASAAIAKGEIAALDMLMRLKLIKKFERNAQAREPFQTLAKEAAYRPFIDTLYAPANEFLKPTGNTVVCRCEEVTAAELHAACDSGADGLRKLKVATRAGMGACQGRMCENSLCEVVTGFTGEPIEQVGQASVRAPVKPVTLGELASLGTEGKNGKNLASH